jgi:hypothetical protein
MKISKLFDYTQPIVSAATILALSAVVIGIIGGYTMYQIKTSSDTVEVTGSAKEAVVADTARWTLSVTTKTGTTDQENGYKKVEAATQNITKFLADQGFTEVEAAAISSYQDYIYPSNSEPVFTGYTVQRNITVRSNDIEKVQKLSNSVEPFSGEGYSVTTQSLELTYSKLADMRVKLLSNAIADAKARAEAIAKESGRKVGSLRTATSGVVQVLPLGSVEISDYGSYDTQSVQKEVMVTVRATFGL